MKLLFFFMILPQSSVSDLALGLGSGVFPSIGGNIYWSGLMMFSSPLPVLGLLLFEVGFN